MRVLLIVLTLLAATPAWAQWVRYAENDTRLTNTTLRR
jgi:hypothetical protein